MINHLFRRTLFESISIFRKQLNIFTFILIKIFCDFTWVFIGNFLKFDMFIFIALKRTVMECRGQI